MDADFPNKEYQARKRLTNYRIENVKKEILYIWWFSEDRFLSENICCLEILLCISKQIGGMEVKRQFYYSKKLQNIK